MNEWALQEAKKRFGAVVKAALAGEAQQVTRRGKPAVVVVAADEYRRLCGAEKNGAPTFIEHLLSIPQDDEEFERLPVAPRTPDF